MVYDSTVKFKNSTTNQSNLNTCHVYIGQKTDASILLAKPNPSHEIPWVKYTIRETDFRIKTATITTPVQMDLTNGVVVVKIVSKLHENFVGEILSDEYTENSDGTYTYQCQDMSREFQSKVEMIINNKTRYRVLQTLLTGNWIGINDKITAKVKKNWKNSLSGLRPLGLYNPKLWGNPISVNMLANKDKLIIRNKSYMEAIRAIALSSGYIDVYFNGNGTLQLEPISIDDWSHTGLWLGTEEIAESKFKFDLTNVITGVVVNGADDTKIGVGLTGKALTGGLDLSAFFGWQDASVDNPNKQTTTTTKTTAKGTAKSKANTKTKVNNKGNPYGKKAKKIWIGADSGSGGFCQEIVKLLRKNGWSVHYSGEGPGVHNSDYDNITSDYQVLGIVDNGFCCTTVKEAFEGYCAPKLKKKNITVMFMFDTRDWTNPNGMKPYRYGNFGNVTIKTAWDDSSGYCTSMKPTSFFKKHNATYCCHPTAAGIVKQFLAGGYFKFKGVK